METLVSLNSLPDNYHHIMKHGISQKDVDDLNMTIALIESSRRKETPIKGDIIECSAPGDGKIRYPQGHLEQSIETEFASICTRGYAPFVYVSEDWMDFSFVTSGGYWLRERELEMYEYIIGEYPKVFCKWGSCGPCHNGAIYFRANVNVWRLIREDIY